MLMPGRETSPRDSGATADATADANTKTGWMLLLLYEINSMRRSYCQAGRSAANGIVSAVSGRN